MNDRNIRLTISYDGAGFSGWQVQPDKRTVQGEVEAAIEKITREPTRLAGAGRTDTGVHAIGQVASFHTHSSIPLERLKPAIQSQLPDDIVIRKVDEVPDEFHAGHAAKWKQYRYLILNSRTPVPHLRNYATRIHDSVNVDAMHAAAQALVGTHDFRSFESHFPNKATSVRTVMHCSVQSGTCWPIWEPRFSARDAGQAYVYLDIVADGFLYNMVRAIMGTLLKIGVGSWEVARCEEILTAMDRRIAGPTAPPQGLYLMHVEYERDFPAAMVDYSASVGAQSE